MEKLKANSKINQQKPNKTKVVSVEEFHKLVDKQIKRDLRILKTLAKL